MLVFVYFEVKGQKLHNRIQRNIQIKEILFQIKLVFLVCDEFCKSLKVLLSRQTSIGLSDNMVLESCSGMNEIPPRATQNKTS